MKCKLNYSVFIRIFAFADNIWLCSCFAYLMDKKLRYFSSAPSAFAFI